MKTRNILLTYRYHLGPWATAIRAARRFLTACRSLNPEKIQLFATAIRDAKKGVTGLHPVYRPGWQPKRRYDR